MCEMQGKDVPIRDVCHHSTRKFHRDIDSDLTSRSTQTVRCRKRVKIRNYHRRQPKLPRWERCSHLPFKRLRLFLRLRRCEEGGLRDPSHLHLALRNLVHPHTAAGPLRARLITTHLQLWMGVELARRRLRMSYLTGFRVWINSTYCMRRETNSNSSPQCKKSNPRKIISHKDSLMPWPMMHLPDGPPLNVRNPSCLGDRTHRLCVLVPKKSPSVNRLLCTNLPPSDL